MSETKKAAIDFLKHAKGLNKIAPDKKSLLNKVIAVLSADDIIIPDTRQDKIKVCLLLNSLFKKIPQLENPLNEKPFARLLDRIGLLKPVLAEKPESVRKYKLKK